MQKYWIKVLAVVTFLAGSGLFSGLASADTAQAISYLSLQQQADGSYIGQDAIATDFQATAETVRSFYFTGNASDPGLPSAHAFLDATSLRNTEYLSRLVVLASISGNDPQPLLDELLLNQNDDGGYGDFTGFDSTVLDTAFALEAIAESGQQPGGVPGMVAFLMDRQAADGSWSDGANEPSVYLSAIAMRSLWHYRTSFSGVDTALARAQSFLLSQRDPATGLWPEPHESALAMIAIVPNVAEFSQVESILTDLANQQAADGSWASDAYITALVVRALASQATPKPPALTTGTVSGRVVNSVTGQPIQDVSVSIASLALATTSDVEGLFKLDNIGPGAYSLTIIAAGYSQVNFSSLTVNIGVDTGLGDVQLSPLPTSGVIQGQVTDAATSQPLAGVSVSVTGAATAQVVTATDGSYSIVGLAPGAVTITLSKNGYLPVTANAQVVTGNTLVLNPALTATGSGSEPLPGTVTTGVLRGVVTDSATSQPVAYASVRIRDAANGASLHYASTAADGSYQIDGIDPRAITIEVSKNGYLSVQASATMTAGNALIFSPGLVADGGDPDSGTGGDVGTEPLPGTATLGELRGTATDLATGLPLAGVNILLAGSHNTTTVTAADGSYVVPDVTPGDISVTASLSSYISVGATASIAAGNALVFNPELPPEGYVGSDNGSVTGIVVDASTQQPLSRVLVRLAGNPGETTTTSSSQGVLQFDDVPPGDYTVSFELSGYLTRAFNVVVTSGGTVDLQTVELSQALTEVAIYGRVTDQDSGEPIENAVISISGTVLSAETDADGVYRIDGIETGARTLVFSATGYNTQTLVFTFPQGGEYEMNRALGLTADTGVDMTFLATDQTVYPAYADATIQASVINNGSPVDAMLVFSLFNSEGHLISEYSGTLAGASDQQIHFPTGVVTEVIANFNTANLPAGDYRLVGRVVVGNLIVGPATIILDERVTRFSIETTERISHLTAETLPGFSAVGIVEDIDVLVTVLNRSNVDTTVYVSYRYLRPDGTVLRNSPGALEILLPVDKDTIVITLDSFAQEFDTAGEHELEINYTVGVPIDTIDASGISVAPGLRVDPSYEIAPGVVTPDGDKRIRIDIRLEGKEVL